MNYSRSALFHMKTRGCLKHFVQNCGFLISFRSSRSHIFLIISLLITFANFTGKHLCWSLFLTKMQALRPTILLERDSNTSVFQWNLRNFEKIFLQYTSCGFFWTFHQVLFITPAPVHKCSAKFCKCFEKVFTNKFLTTAYLIKKYLITGV